MADDDEDGELTVRGVRKKNGPRGRNFLAYTISKSQSERSRTAAPMGTDSARTDGAVTAKDGETDVCANESCGKALRPADKKVGRCGKCGTTIPRGLEGLAVAVPVVASQP